MFLFNIIVLYAVSWRYKRNYLYASIDILFYIMFYIIDTMKKHETLSYHVCNYDKKKVHIWTDPPPPFPIPSPSVNYL